MSSHALITAAKKPIAARCSIVLALSLAPVAAADPLDERAGALLVCAQGPGAAIARARELHGEAGVHAAGVLPNPTLSAQHQRAIGGERDEETIIGLTVSLGIGGRRFILQDAAALRREQARLDAGLTRLDSAIAFRETFVAAVIDEARARVLAEQQAALDALSTTIRGLSKGGEAASYDVLRQETHARTHRRLLASVAARAEAARAELEAWIGAPVSLAGVSIEQLAGGAYEVTAGPHPRVRALEAESRAAELEAAAGRRRWVPDVDVFAGYREATVATETGRGISLSISVPITVFDHGQGEAAIAEAEAEIARASAAQIRRQNEARFAALSARLRALSASLDAATTTDATALETKATQLYAAGEASITELLEAFRSAEEARLGVIDVAEEIAMLRLARMRAAGSSFDDALDAACGAGRESP